LDFDFGIGGTCHESHVRRNQNSTEQSASVFQSASGEAGGVQSRAPSLPRKNGDRGGESFLWFHRQRRRNFLPGRIYRGRGVTCASRKRRRV